MGPNMRRLVALRMSLEAIPAGSANPVMAGVNFILSGQIPQSAARAQKWAKEVCAVVLQSKECPYKDEEEVAGEIVRRTEEKMKAQRERRQK